MFKREELQQLRQRAEDEAKVGGLNPQWKRAYLRLSSALDHLDAMIARIEEGNKRRSKMDTKNRLWICGQLKGDWKETGSVWEFQGIFSSNEKARNACRNEKYFIFSAQLDEELIDESYLPEDACYPLFDRSTKS